MRFQRCVYILIVSLVVMMLADQGAAQTSESAASVLLVPEAVWDGTKDAPQKGFVVLIKGGRIEAVGKAADVNAPRDTQRVELTGSTLIPGLIEGHSHLFLHPYNEVLWDDQVLKEPLGFRMAQAVAHARCGTAEPGDRPAHGWPFQRYTEVVRGGGSSVGP